MEQEIFQFRRDVVSYFGGRPGRGARYPQELKAQAVKLALGPSVEAGLSLSGLSQELGVGVGTLKRWLDSAGSTVSKLRTVEIVEEEPVEGLAHEPGGGRVVVTRCGHRVEGLTLAEVALLLEALG